MLTPVGAFLICVFAILVIVLPKKYSALPFYLSIFFMASGEQIQIAGFSFFGYRLVLLVAAVRIISRGEIKNYSLERHEWIFILSFVWTAFAAGYRVHSVNTMLNACSSGFDAVFTYLYARSTYSGSEQVKHAGMVFVAIMLPFCVLLFAESLTNHDYFSVLRGVSEYPTIRNGKIRAAGPFSHAILAGTAVALHMPFALQLFKDKKVYGALGILAILITVKACNSSGPIMTLLFTLIGMGLWFRRERVYIYRQRFYILVVILEIYRLFKHGHVWDYIGRIDLTGSSTGAYRSELITSWLSHFNEWWAIGTEFTRHWMATGVPWSPNHTDITDHYIAVTVNGGLFPLVVFVYMIYRSFKKIGDCLKLAESDEEKLNYWVLGSILFANTCTFISVAYFDQTILLYFYLLGIIAAAYNNAKRKTVNERASDLLSPTL